MKNIILKALLGSLFLATPIQSQQKTRTITKTSNLRAKQLAIVIGFLKTFAPPRVVLLKYKDGTFSQKPLPKRRAKPK